MYPFFHYDIISISDISMILSILHNGPNYQLCQMDKYDASIMTSCEINCKSISEIGVIWNDAYTNGRTE